MLDESAIRSSVIEANGIRLHVVEAGDPAGQPVFLLHGLPEFWRGWRFQIGPLAAAGLRLIVPDQRGYNLSDKPKGLANYDFSLVTGDVLGLADRLGLSSFSVVGHDWGAAVGWWLATRWPDRISRLAVLAAPHPALWREAMLNDPVQRKRSRYVKFIQIPWLPEFMMRLGRFAGLVGAIKQTRRAEAFPPEEIERYREAWAQPGALTAMLNWYRALPRAQMPPADQCRVRVPTLILWGRAEAFAVPWLADASLKLCDQGRLEVLDATHWIQYDEAERVNQMLIEFLSA
ncbi:MAG TPA: alpha/beta hydrolase [Pirellulales bacterium]|jgi:pimeloyl-ACP methyl ester carboxylesterase